MGRTRHYLLAFLSLLAVPSLLFAQTLSAPRKPRPTVLRHVVLSNGFRVTLAMPVMTDGPLTPFLNARGRTDENGYVRVSAGTAGVTDGPLTPFANLRVRTDENGYLRVSCASGCSATFTPPGSDTQVIFNDGGVAGASSGLTFAKSTGILATNALAMLPTVAANHNETSESPYGAIQIGITNDGNGTVNINSYNGQVNTGEALDVQSFNDSSHVAPAEAIYGEMFYQTPTGTTGYNLAAVNAKASLGSGAGTVPGMWAFRSRLTATNPLATVAEVGGLDIEAPGGGLGLNIAEAYGIRIGDISGATTSYAIKTGLGKVSFGGTLTAAGLTYPSADGTAGQYISTNGSGTLTFTTPATTTVNNIKFNNGKGIQTDIVTNSTLVAQAYDVNDATYRTFFTLTAANTPSLDLSAPSGGTLTGNFSTLQVGSADVATGASSTTLTNKTLDAEGTGNTLTVPMIYHFAVGVCQGTSASIGLSTPASDPAVAACVTGTNTQVGVAQFADGASSLSTQGHFALPSDWTGAIDLKGKWRTSATSGAVVWQVATICVADAETIDPAFNTASTVTETAKGTTNQLNDFSISSVTVTGCAAGEELFFKFFRDPAHGSDTLAATAELVSLSFTVRRAM